MSLMKKNSEKMRQICELSAVMDAFASVAGQNIEVVLHDLSQPESSVVKIINGHISGRNAGSSLLEGPENDRGFIGLLDQDTAKISLSPEVIAGYRTVTGQGKVLRSSTVLFRDNEGRASLSLCFNADYSAVEAATDALAALLPTRSSKEEKSESGLEEKMDEIIRLCIPPSGTLQTGASKRQKVEIVRLMQQKGMFMVRGGVEKAARVLGVTRYTIYNYLDEVKRSSAID